MIAPSTIVAFVKQNPLLFNAFTGGILCATSDAMAQHLEEDWQPLSMLENPNPANADAVTHPEQRQRPYLAPSMTAGMVSAAKVDWVRVASAGVIGSFFGGIVYLTAYAKLDAIWVGTKFATVLKKSLVEIATVGIFVNSISMTSRGILRGDQNSTSVIRHVSSELPTVTKNDFVVWMPYNILAFSIIPAVLRPTTTAAMEASWQTYISLRSHDYDRPNAETATTTIATTNPLTS